MSKEREATVSVNDVPAEQKQNERMTKLTFRVSQGEADALREIADKYNISLSALIRHATCGNVAKALGDIRYIDRAQAQVINKNLVVLGNIMSDIQQNLRRIGVNYNQQIKLKQIERKRAAAKPPRMVGGHYNWNLDTDEEDKFKAEEKKIIDSCEELDTDKIDELIKRYEVATREAGKIICRIVG